MSMPYKSSEDRKLEFKKKLSSSFYKKPLPTVQDDVLENGQIRSAHLHKYSSIETSEPNKALERHLSLLDLVSIGIGGTIGSGFFVLSGLVSHEYAGPATVISMLISGMAACISGCCYAELSARIPLAGGAYAYSYVAMGEWPAVLAAACLTLEYVAAASAVARSWGDKVVVWLEEQFEDDHIINRYLDVDQAFSPLAFLVSLASVILLLNGVKESKQVTNFFTAIKVGVVLFMVFAGFYFVRPSNWSPFIPSEFGAAGVLKGAASTFFGYLGYDQVCGIAGEAIDPKKTLPRAILWVLIGVTVLYMTGTLALNGMQNYKDINSVSGFPAAFYANHAWFAGELTALGEIITLPVVVLITIMAQPRLQFAMAVDGLLPQVFAELNHSGNLYKGTAVSGFLMVLIAAFIPFKYLNDVISCAVLTALSMTGTSVILLWHETPNQPNSGLTERLMFSFHGAAWITSIVLTNFLHFRYGKLIAVIGTFAMIVISCCIFFLCPRSDIFGGHRERYRQEKLRRDDGYFRTPFVPFWPCVGIFSNWYLISQLSVVGVSGFMGILALASFYYFYYAQHHSMGNRAYDREQEQDGPNESTKLTDAPGDFES